MAVVDDTERTLRAALQFTEPEVAVKACVRHEVILAHSLHAMYRALRATAAYHMGTEAATRDEVMGEAEEMGDHLVATYSPNLISSW